jgi:hypothetical protein
MGFRRSPGCVAHHRALAIFLTFVVGCTRPPDRVFVPGSPFTHVVEVRTAQGLTAEVKTGEWLTLHASRRTGPWTEVDRKSLGPNGCWSGSAPPSVEPEVATDVSWRTDPLNAGEFDDGLRPDSLRLVRFSVPGRYVLRAASSTYCSAKADSNTLVVVVRP